MGAGYTEMMKMLDKIKKWFEPEKCEICGANNSIVHECFCFERTLGYNISEGESTEEKIYMMRMKGQIK